MTIGIGSDVAGGGPSTSSADGKSDKEKAYHAKRPHRKSRNGCRNCKTRKVKCDEAKPSCRTCTLRRETCVYLSTTPSTSPSPSSSTAQSVLSSGITRLPLLPPLSPSPSSPSHSPSTVTSSLAAAPICSLPSPDNTVYDASDPSDLRELQGLRLLQEPAPIPVAGRDLDDMKLLWAYSTSTYLSFVTNIKGVERLKHALKDKVVEYAVHSPFLMDCVLALTTMHMGHLGRTDVLGIRPTKSIVYRARAFEGYRKAVEAARPSTFPALIASSLLLCGISSQMFQPEVDPTIRRLYILNWIVVWRGIGLVLDLASKERTLEQSGLGDLFVRPPVNLNLSALHIPSNLLFMVSSIKPGDVDFPDVEVYYDTLKFLGSLYKELAEHGFSPVLDLRIIVFYTFVPSRFVDLALKRRPRALVIIAHHLALLKLVQTVWWTEGICDPQIRDICEVLGEEWVDLLSVPRAATKIADIQEIAKLLLGNHAWEPPSRDEIYKTQPDPRELWSAVWVNNDGKVQDFYPERIGGA